MQTFEFISANDHVPFNETKLNKLPQFLSKLTINFAMPIAVQEVLFNKVFICKVFILLFEESKKKKKRNEKFVSNSIDVAEMLRKCKKCNQRFRYFKTIYAFWCSTSAILGKFLL